MSGLAPTIEILIAARVLQGLGSGLLNPQTTGIIQQNFTGQARARAYGMFGTVVALAVIVGPVLGGFLIQIFGDSLGWRMMFLINVPIGLLGIFLSLRWLPNDRLRADTDTAATRRRLDLDPVGMATLALATLAILLPFVQRSDNLWMWTTLPLGLALTVFFVMWENRYKKAGRPPMVDMDLVRRPAFRNGILIVTLYFLGNTSVWLIVPIYLQTHLHQSALIAAGIGIPSALLSAFAAPWAGKRVLKAGRRMIIAGFLFSMTSIAATMLMINPVESGAVPLWALAISLMFLGIGGGLTISPNQTLTLKSVEVQNSGVAGGILSLGQRMGTAIGTALIPSIMYGLVDSGAHWNIGFAAAFAGILVLLVAGLTVTIIDRRREVAEERKIQ